jgi:WD40 repeat protein
MFAVGYADGHAELRDSVSGNTIQTWDTGGGPVLELAFCVPSRCIATRGLDGAVRLWPFDRAEEIARLGHAIVPRQIAFTRDGRWLLVGVPQLDDSGEVEFWSMNELMPK